jgi:hypothetical protein
MALLMGMVALDEEGKEVHKNVWVFTIFEDSGASGGGRDSGPNDKDPVEAAVVTVFKVSSSVCIVDRLLVQLNIPSKRESSHKMGLALKWAFIHAKISKMLGLAWAWSWVHASWMSFSVSGLIGTLLDGMHPAPWKALGHRLTWD